DYPVSLLYSVQGKDVSNVEETLVTDYLLVKASAVKASEIVMKARKVEQPSVTSLMRAERTWHLQQLRTEPMTAREREYHQDIIQWLDKDLAEEEQDERLQAAHPPPRR